MKCVWNNHWNYCNICFFIWYQESHSLSSKRSKSPLWLPSPIKIQFLSLTPNLLSQQINTHCSQHHCPNQWKIWSTPHRLWFTLLRRRHFSVPFFHCWWVPHLFLSPLPLFYGKNLSWSLEKAKNPICYLSNN